jgi:hypothetical protein
MSKDESGKKINFIKNIEEKKTQINSGLLELFYFLLLKVLKSLYCA